MTLYKCEGFTEKCYRVNECVIKNTFDPTHIWLRNNVVRHKMRNGETLDVMCKKDDTLKKVEVAE